MRFPGVVTLVLAGLLVSAPAVARAEEHDDEDVRVEVSCSRSSELRLRLRTLDDSDALRLVLEVRTPRRGTRWAVVVVHERRLVTRRIHRTNLSSGSFTLRRTIPDWPGRDTVSVRAVGPRGELCRASATVQGDD